MKWYRVLPSLSLDKPKVRSVATLMCLNRSSGNWLKWTCGVMLWTRIQSLEWPDTASIMLGMLLHGQHSRHTLMEMSRSSRHVAPLHLVRNQSFLYNVHSGLKRQAFVCVCMYVCMYVCMSAGWLAGWPAGHLHQICVTMCLLAYHVSLTTG